MKHIVATFDLPLRIESCANLREHWAARAKRAKLHRMSAAYAVSGSQDWTLPDGKITVRLVRIGRKLLDDDNLAGAFKAVRDGVADALGLDDADPRLRWVYAQEMAKEYGCRIEIHGRPHAGTS